MQLFAKFIARLIAVYMYTIIYQPNVNTDDIDLLPFVAEFLHSQKKTRMKKRSSL